MRHALALPFAFAFAVTSLLACFAEGRARAADAELPAGDEPARFVPTATVDAYFGYSFTPPKEGVDSISFATTGNRHDEFAINLASVGARLEHAHLLGAVALQAGTSVDMLYPQSGTSNALGYEVYKHVQLAWAGYREGNFTFALGLFSSLFGIEAFPTTSNWNYTKAFVSDMTPYYQEGAKLSWRFLPGWKATVAASNGWQTHGHIKKTPSWSGRLDWSITDAIKIYGAGHVGHESLANKSDLRVYSELGGQADFGKRVSVALQIWSAMQGKSEAFGGAVWAKWSFVDRLYVAIRGEHFEDKDGVLFEGLSAPFFPAVPSGTKTGATFEAATLTLGWVPHESFVVKLEGTYRHADREAFYGDATPVGSSSYAVANDKQSITSILSAAFVY
jgi:hypothetical protein